jgi:hypothetical protein
LNLSNTKQTRLVEILKNQGQKAFKKEFDYMERIKTGKKSRGIPPGVYEVIRVTWNKSDKKESLYLKTLSNAASKKGMTIPEFVKDFIRENIDKIERESN